MAYRSIDLRKPSLDWLLVLVPVAAISDYGFHNDLLTFVTSALAILPLAGLIGRATEQLAAHAGPKAGGLLNATFGNVAELIISIFLILKGELDVVKASLIGSIIGNLLLVLGLSLFVGGLRHPQQRYSAHAASVHSTSLILAVTGLLMPALFVLSTGANEFAERETVSVVVAFGELVRPGAQHEQGRHEQAGDRQDEGCGVHAGGMRAVSLLGMAEPADEQRQPQDQEEVPDDRADEGGLHHVQLALQDQEDRDDELGHVAERGVEQPAGLRPGVRRELLGGPPDESGQREDGQGRREEREQLVVEPVVGDGRDRHQDQQPVQARPAQVDPAVRHDAEAYWVLNPGREPVGLRGR